MVSTGGNVEWETLGQGISVETESYRLTGRDQRWWKHTRSWKCNDRNAEFIAGTARRGFSLAAMWPVLRQEVIHLLLGFAQR